MELSTGPRDARGRILEEGDEIILNAKGVIYYRIARIEPVLDPTAPPDMLYVHVSAIIPFLCKRGVVNPEFVRVRTLAEAGPLGFALTTAPATAEDPQ